MKSISSIATSLVSAALFILCGCGAADEGQPTGDPGDVPVIDAAPELQSCTPSFSRTCGSWSRCECVLVELGTGNCLEYGQWANCTDYYVNYNCSTSTVGPRTVKRAC
jgi:hypothetical protein